MPCDIEFKSIVTLLLTIYLNRSKLYLITIDKGFTIELIMFIVKKKGELTYELLTESRTG